jgi:two-component system, OmpR family, sensor histidine kinase VicK
MQKADHSFITRLGDICGEGVAVYDLNTRKFVYTNRYFRDIFEVDEDVPIDDGNVLLKYINEEDREHLHERYVELLSIGCISATEFALKVRDKLKRLSGEVLWLEESYAMAVFVKDVTREKEHENYVLKYTAQKDTLLDMLIHNLSGPLMLSKEVIGLIEKNSDKSNEHVSRLVNIIRQNTQECLDIVNDFLKREFSDSSKVVTQNSRFDLVQKIREVMDVTREMNLDKQLILKSDIDMLLVDCDPVKLLQIIQNLLSNAIKFTPKNGVIEFRISEQDKTFSIAVKDNGIGVPEDVKPLLFIDKIKGREGVNGEVSNGMGLYLSHKLVTLLKGKISFISSDEGSEFKIVLPKE